MPFVLPVPPVVPEPLRLFIVPVPVPEREPVPALPDALEFPPERIPGDVVLEPGVIVEPEPEPEPDMEPDVPPVCAIASVLVAAKMEAIRMERVYRIMVVS
ncbi:hypothetical protein GCM10007242_17490 [Pigmentiphaga litoralis]|nr:hypothetical protein GCM10007242_17490 [Pigmentiphaga litoralis]